MIDEADKPFTITFEDRSAYLRAHVSGTRDTVEISLRYWGAAADECRRRGMNRMLVVEDFQTSAPIADVFEVAKRLPEIVRGIRVAFVNERLAELDANKFGEDVAVNRGASGRVFADFKSADAWLRQP